MATVAELIADAEDLLDGSDEGTLEALKKYRAAAMLAASKLDYDSAVSCGRAAMAAIAMLPDASQGGRGVSIEQTWSAAKIEQFIAEMRRAQREESGATLQSIPIKYVRERSDDSY